MTKQFIFSITAFAEDEMEVRTFFNDISTISFTAENGFLRIDDEFIKMVPFDTPDDSVVEFVFSTLKAFANRRLTIRLNYKINYFFGSQ